ncbi:MAG TPA: putative nucleotidyltransferase substrate binding domain-containing protein [Thermoleophilaceae bacterium]|nr:putative nucleotidyltransferase substrate binding domain-containing protein [Thermoleophilaceae bacterium]
MHDIAEFLRGHPPFDTVDEPTLEEIARNAEIEFHPARTTITDASEAPLEHGCVVRTGSVELVIDGRLLDLMGEGEMFGFVSLLSEDPPDFIARAAQDTLIYRIPADVLRPVLQRPAFVRFVTQVMNRRVRLLVGHETQASTSFAARPVAELIRAPALVCSPATGVQEAARRMADAGATSVVVDTGDGLGIVTDRDIRTRVVAAGAGPDTPLGEVMTVPAWTVAADRTATEALLEMLTHGIRHLPVLSADRRLIGVVDDVDLMANERRAPFHIQNAIGRGATVDDVASAAAELPAMVIDLFDAALPPNVICRAITSVHDVVTRRLIEFAEDELGRPPVPYTWLATGSFGRFEPFPNSDVDCAIAWDGPDDDLELRRTMITLAARVLEGLEACGFPPDSNTVVASNPLFARSIDEWERAATTWVEQPDQDKGVLLLSVVVESDPVWGPTDAAARLANAFAHAPNRRLMLRRLAAAAVAVRPPTGFLRDFVLHSSGERKGVLDIKRGGLLPVDNLARWSGLRAGVSAASTRARLRASRDAGTLTAEQANTLRDAFELFCLLRMEHQVRQLRDGERPDNLIAPRSLTPVTRSALKEAFRAVARVQQAVATQVGLRI